MNTRPTGYWHRAIRGGLSFLTDQVLTAAQKAQARENIGISNPMQVLYRLTSANMNTTADQAWTKLHSGTAYTINAIRGRNGSIDLTGAIGGIYTGAGKTGIVLVLASQAYSAFTASTKGANLSSLTNEALARLTADPIFALSTARGLAATMDLEIIGWEVP